MEISSEHLRIAERKEQERYAELRSLRARLYKKAGRVQRKGERLGEIAGRWQGRTVRQRHQLDAQTFRSIFRFIQKTHRAKKQKEENAKTISMFARRLGMQAAQHKGKLQTLQQMLQKQTEKRRYVGVEREAEQIEEFAIVRRAPSAEAGDDSVLDCTPQNESSQRDEAPPFSQQEPFEQAFSGDDTQREFPQEELPLPSGMQAEAELSDTEYAFRYPLGDGRLVVVTIVRREERRLSLRVELPAGELSLPEQQALKRRLSETLQESGFRLQSLYCRSAEGV